MSRKTSRILVTLLAACSVFASVAAAPFTKDLRNHDHRAHLHKSVERTPNLDVPTTRMTDLPCVDGMAGMFLCDGIDLVAFIPDDEMFNAGVQPLGGGLSDIWGWVDPETGNEYVLFGKTNGTAVYDITDPRNALYLGDIANTGPAQLQWHDIKINDNYAYIVSETPGHGVKVFDLTILRGLGQAPVTPFELPIAAVYPFDGTAHNIVIDEGADMAYIVGSGQALGNGGLCDVEGRGVRLAGLHAIDISNPLSPTYVGCHTEDTYIHDAHCTSYIGPDADHQGKRICLTSNEDSVSIVDVTDPANTVQLSRIDYPGVSYSHQGWMSEDQATYFHGDETDEQGAQLTRTFVFDISDLDTPVLSFINEPGGKNIDHNMYTHEGLLYQSNYTAGLQVFDTAFVGERRLPMVAEFDTYPNDRNRDPATFHGTWSNYPYFPSGIIAVTGIDEGLFLLKLQDHVVSALQD